MEMTDLSRREFTKLVAGAGVAAGLADFPARAAASERTIAIQVGAVSFSDEGVDQVLDIFQRDAEINTLCIATFSYGRGIAGREIPGQPLPDHGSRQYDTNFYGGNYATTHEKYYGQTPLKKIQSPDLPGFDVLAQVLPRAKARGMKTYCWYEDVFRRDLPGAETLQEVSLSGRKAGTLCFHNPGVQGFWHALTEDYVRSYPVDGVMWCCERQGPFGNALGASHGGANENPFEVRCFCEYCKREARSRGLDAARAMDGYTKLANLVRQSRAGERPSDGYFVSYWRLLTDYPEILGWEKLWNDGQKKAYHTIRDISKSLRPELPVGWHIWHNNSFSPFYRAEQDYADFANYSDFLKVVMYNNCGGPRLASYIQSVSRTFFADFSPEEALQLTYKIMNYNEAPLSDLPTRGLSADYVERETRRAVAGVDGKVKIWPGIDIDVPTGRDQKRTRPEDVREAVRAALRGGADGLILSRKYSEMRLANLRAVKDGLNG